jgi:hypothetical protein
VKLGRKGKFKVRRGALHAALGIPAGDKIGHDRMEEALQSPKSEVRKMARSGLGLSAMDKD